jgi:Uma2 family endonuclease
MAVVLPVSSVRGKLYRYVRAPRPVVFPVEEDVPESKRHLELRTALYLIVKLAMAETAVFGSDQFVYWDPTNPKACLAPDLLIKLGGPDTDYDTWKVWERGAPDIAVEIASRSDSPEMAWEEKLERYQKIGLKELVRYDWKKPKTSLRIWDSVEGDLVERVMEGEDATLSSVLPYYWTVVNDMLRLAEDAAGSRLLPTYEERAQTEAARAQTEAARAQTEAARADTAEAEVLRLRAELARLHKPV